MGVAGRITLALGTICLAVLARSGAAQGGAGAPPDTRMLAMLPTTTNSPAARAHLERGQRALDLGRMDEAKAHFAEAVRADPQFAFAHLQLARTAASPAEAREHFEHAAAGMASATAAERLTIRYYQQGRDGSGPAAQLETARELTKALPRSPRAWMLLAEAQARLRQFADARASAERATELGPRFLPAYTGLVNSWLFQAPTDFAKAEQYASRIVAMEPEEALGYDLLGDVYRAQGRLLEARTAYARMIRLRPDDAVSWNQRAHVELNLGEYDAARADFDSAARRAAANERIGNLQMRAMVPAYRGSMEAAVRELEDLADRTERLSDTNVVGQQIGILQTAASIALEAGLLPAARRAIDRLVPLWRQQAEQSGTPDARRDAHANPILWEGQYLAYSGDYAGARAKAAEFMREVAGSKSPTRDEPAQMLLGLTEVLDGRYAAALTHLDPLPRTSMYVQYWRARALEGLGRTEEARQLFHVVASNNFNNLATALTRYDAARRAARP